MSHSVLSPSFLRRTALAAALGLSGLAAHAEGSMLDGWSVFVGVAHLDINALTRDLSSTPATLPEGIHAGITVGDATTVGFGAAYRFNPKWSAELVLGLPPEHSVYGTKFIEPFGQITLVKQAPPSAFLNYHFDSIGDFQPFVGLGVNYTRFLRTRGTGSGDAASGGPTQVHLTNSWGWAGHIGGTYQIDRNWSVVGTVAYANVRTAMKATTEGNLGDGPVEIVRTTPINFRPAVYTLSVGYSF